MKINCFYCNFNNFGDRLNELLFKCEIGYETTWSIFDRAMIIGIGSIMKTIIENGKMKNKFNNEDPIFCFSSGFDSEKQILEILKEKKEIRLSRPVVFLAVRGEKTKELLIKYRLMSEKCEPVIADGGLLASDLLTDKIVKKYEVGIVAHAHEKKNPVFREMMYKIPNAILIDIQQEPIAFLRSLAECETVISTAMHPLIASDSLRIPNAWIRLSEKDAATKKFKFKDYYSAFGLEKEPLDVCEIDKCIKDVVIKKYDIPDEIIEEKKKELRNVLMILKEVLDSDKESLLRKFRSNQLYMLTRWYPHRFFVENPKRIVNKIIRTLNSK